MLGPTHPTQGIEQHFPVIPLVTAMPYTNQEPNTISLNDKTKATLRAPKITSLILMVTVLNFQHLCITVDTGPNFVLLSKSGVFPHVLKLCYSLDKPNVPTALINSSLVCESHYTYKCQSESW